jgi:hypothetical protein
LPVTYVKDGHHEAGLLAQDQVRAGYDQYVATYPNKALAVQVDADGFTWKAGLGLSLNYDNYVAYLIAGLQSALARIETLERRAVSDA